MKTTIDTSIRRELVAQLLSKEPMANGSSNGLGTPTGIYYPDGTCAIDGDNCSNTCAWTWTPFRG